MPGTLPIIPTEENRDTLESYLNLQRQLESVLLKQSRTYDDIGHISKDLELSTKKRLEREKQLLNENINDISILQRKLLSSFEITEGVQRKEFNFATKAMEERMLLRRKEMELLRESAAIEKEMAERKFKEDNKWGMFISKISKEQFGFKVKEYDMTKSIAEELQKYPNSIKRGAGVWAVLITILAGAYELFKTFDTAAWSFRKAMGFTRDDAEQFRKIAEKLAIDFAHVGVTIDGAYKAQLALGKAMGSVNTISYELVKNVAIMSAQLGVSEEAASGFLHNMAAISKSTTQSQQDMMYIAADMSKAAGVPLDAVMKDVSSRTTQTLTMMSRIPNVVLRTAIEARRLNTTMNEMARASRTILDFSENVNAEMDASVLLGRSINLQRARELAYRRDLEGSTKEIMRITKNINFENLDVFQQEAFARATGHTVDELLRMVTAERQWEKARRDPDLKGKVEAYEKLRKSNEAIAKARGKDLQLMLQQKANQERIVAIQNKWNQIMMKAEQFLLPIVDRLLSIVNGMMSLGPMAMIFVGAIQKTLTSMGIWATVSTKIMDIFSIVGLKIFNLGGIFKSIGTFIVSMGYNIFEIFGKFGKFLGFFGRWVPVIGWVITAFQFISNLFTRFGEIEFVKGDWIGNIWKGLKAIGGALYDTLLKPFVDAWNWVKGKWGGNSPSEIGLSILNGIVSIGGSLFDAITSPWRKALAWIFDKIPGMGKVAEKLRGGVSAMLNEPVEKKATSAYVPAVTVTPNGRTELNPTAKDASAQAEKTKDTTTLADVVASNNIIAGKLDALLDALKAGQIGINMDGQLLSATLARQTEFRGGYGVNNI